MACKYPENSRSYLACDLCPDNQTCSASSRTNNLQILSANEARLLTEQYTEAIITRQLAEISTKIEYAAKEGKKSVSLDGVLNNAVREKLEKVFKYKIETGSQYNRSYFIISW